MNNVIFLGRGNDYNGKYKNIIHFIDCNDFDVNSAVKLCYKYDVIIFYNLDYYKSLIVNRLPKRIKKVWFFYGTEFYGLPKYRLDCYSFKTRNSLHISKYYHAKRIAVDILRIIKYGLLLKMAPYAEFCRAINKLDYFFWFDKDGYSNMKKHWKSLPPFLELKTLKLMDTHKVIKARNRATSENYIVVGNSRAPENNSLDIIDLFNNYLPAGRISLMFPLSYGEKGNYYDDLINRIRSSHIKIDIIDNFMPYDAYVEKIIDAKAAIINSYRPMGQGNMFLYLENGVKLYLSENNSSYNWFRSLGFFVSSVESDLKNDIINNSLSLSPDQAEINKTIFNRLSDNHSVINSQHNFYEVFKAVIPNG